MSKQSWINRFAKIQRMKSSLQYDKTPKEYLEIAKKRYRDISDRDLHRIETLKKSGVIPEGFLVVSPELNRAEEELRLAQIQFDRSHSIHRNKIMRSFPQMRKVVMELNRLFNYPLGKIELPIYYVNEDFEWEIWNKMEEFLEGQGLL